MEENQYNSKDKINQSIPLTPRRLSEHLDHSLGTVSFVWNHFIKDTDYKNNKKATCNHCKKVYTHTRQKYPNSSKKWFNNRITSTTSDQNLMIYDSLDSSWQNAYNRSVFVSLGSMNQKLYANV